LNIPVPPIAFITGLLESNSKGIVIRFKKKVNCHWSKKGQEENQDKGGWLIPGIGNIPYPSSTIRPAPRSKEGNEDGIECPVSKKAKGRASK
jgi:hypothetical protein